MTQVVPPKRKRDWKGWAIAGGAIVAVAGVGWLTSPHPTQPPATTSYTPPPPAAVMYDVTGSTSTADITYSTPSGNSQQGVDVPLTMKSGERGMTVQGFSAGDFLYMSAQNGQETGTVTCQIKVDGKVVAENTASGAYAIATCKSQL